MEQSKFEEQVDKYLDGQLGRKQIEELWIDMVKDPSRLEYVKTVANTKEVIQNMRSEAGRDKDTRSGWVPYIKYAAAAAVALVIGILSMYQWSGSEQPAVEPIDAIELNYYRGGSDDVESAPKRVNDVIKKAISMANSGSTAQAIELLEKRKKDMEEPKNTALLSLNIGSIQYNNGRFKKAISSFNEVIGKKQHIEVLTLEKAYWFLGNSYFQRGNMVDAREAIRKAYELDGAYRRVAGTYLNAMANK